MKPNEVVGLMQFYRHELLNHLQIIQGYMTLRNAEKANTAMKKLLSSLQMERNLLSLNIPNFFLRIFHYQMNYQQYTITYSVEIKNINNSKLDDYITERLDGVMQEIIRDYSGEKVYRVHLAFKEENEKSRLVISVDDEIIAQIELNIS